MKHKMTIMAVSAALMAAAAAVGCKSAPETPKPERDYVIVVHGGAGNMGGLARNTEKAEQYYAALDSALMIGNEILSKGGEGIDAVIAVVEYFEGNPLFNAGIGATISAEGFFELDAAIMDGKDLSAGSVAGVKHIKHPIAAANAVRTSSPHVMLSGTGAEEFAESNNLEMVDDNTYFATPGTMRWVKEFQKKSKKNGTVGCVVLDSHGNLAAGTSTGGMFKKRWGRIGDAPIIGAGTYADNGSCAVSCTGHGEYFIRHAVAHNLSARIKYLGEDITEAARHILFEDLNSEEGNGGLIAVDKDGNFTMEFNSTGMFRGYLYKESATGEIRKACGIDSTLVQR